MRSRRHLTPEQASRIGESLELVRQIDRQPWKLIGYRLCGDGLQVAHLHRRKPILKRPQMDLKTDERSRCLRCFQSFIREEQLISGWGRSHPDRGKLKWRLPRRLLRVKQPQVRLSRTSACVTPTRKNLGTPRRDAYSVAYRGLSLLRPSEVSSLLRMLTSSPLIPTRRRARSPLP
jgi:hypothetical protein